MRKFINGHIVEMTDAEKKAHVAEGIASRKTSKIAPMSVGDVALLIISNGINDIEVDNNVSLRLKDYYPAFEAIVGKIVKKGFKFTYGDKLWAVVQPELTIQGHYAPGPGLESLYTEVCETFDGTEDDPIPYNNNMALENGKHYIQDNVLYKCFRDTINPVYNPLTALVDLYVTVVVDLND